MDRKQVMRIVIIISLVAVALVGWRMLRGTPATLPTT